MKLTNNRLYLDFNATSPLASKVTDFLAGGDLFYANPSSTHSSGKSSKKIFLEVYDFIFQFFNLPKTEFNLVFHSGATEALNTFLNQDGYDLLYSVTDHPSVKEVIKDKKRVFEYDFLNGIYPNIDREKLILNATWVNNESGVVHDLESIKQLKKKYNAITHVDCSQVVGKVKDFDKLDPFLDIYTFSGHKFGALGNTGFSFVKKSLSIDPLIRGSLLHEGLRSGTLNTLGIYSLKLALEDLTDQSYFTKLKSFQDKVFNLVKSNKNLNLLSFKKQSLNTCFFYHSKISSDLNLVKFDMAQIDISAGSACSSGVSKGSPLLQALGYGEYAKNGLRISWGKESLANEDEVLQRLSQVIQKL